MADDAPAVAPEAAPGEASESAGVERIARDHGDQDGDLSMTRSKISRPGEKYFAVRVVLPGALLHFAARTEPTIEQTFLSGRLRIDQVHAEWIDDPNIGDTIAYIDWHAVTAISWRWTGEVNWHWMEQGRGGPPQ
jgi:hypothetical protein